MQDPSTGGGDGAEDYTDIDRQEEAHVGEGAKPARWGRAGKKRSVQAKGMGKKRAAKKARDAARGDQ